MSFDVLDVMRASPVWRAYTLSTRGLLRAGRARAETALPKDGKQRAAALVLVGELRRRGGDQSGASQSFMEAAELFSKERHHRGRATCLALATDCDVLRGALDDASARLKTADDAAAAESLVLCARGHASDARQRMRPVAESAGDTWSDLWLDLVRAEVLLEMGGLAGAAQALDRVAAGLTDDLRFTELALRARYLRAWTELQMAWTRRSETDTSHHGARAAIASLARYAHAFPLYRALAAQLEGELNLILNVDAGTAFAKAREEASIANAPFLRARLEARQAVQSRAAIEARTQGTLDAARAILVDAGATARAAALVPKAVIDRGTQRRSIAVRLEQDAATTDAQGLEAVVEVSRYLASIRDLPTLLEKTLDSVARVLRAERAALLEEAPDGRLRCVAAKGLKPEEVREDSAAITFSVVREAKDTGEAVLTDNALSDERFRERKSVVATDIRSVMCSPIRTKNRTFGYIYLDRRVLDVAFQAEQQDLLAAFCTQVGVAWENAVAFNEIEELNASLEAKVKERTLELRESLEQLTNTRLKLAEAQRDALEKEMALARDIQKTILPAEAVLEGPGVRLFGQVIPASYCGGDFWTWTRLDDARSLLVVADVTGHGVAASLITAVARACLDTLSLIGEVKGPGAVLRAMNDVIHQAAGGRLCATAFAVVVDSGAHTLTFASAGHNPPWHVSAKDGSAAPLIARGRRVGEERDAEYEESSVPYAQGDRLVLYTDGLVEWMGPKGKPYGDRRFRKAVEASFQKEPPELVFAVHADATSFAAGVERDDDLTLVAVELRVA